MRLAIGLLLSFLSAFAYAQSSLEIYHAMGSNELKRAGRINFEGLDRPVLERTSLFDAQALQAAIKEGLIYRFKVVGRDGSEAETSIPASW